MHKIFLTLLVVSITLTHCSTSTTNSNIIFSVSKNKILYLEDVPNSDGSITINFPYLIIYDTHSKKDLRLLDNKYVTTSAVFSFDGKDVIFSGLRDGLDLVRGVGAPLDFYKISIETESLDKYVDIKDTHISDLSVLNDSIIYFTMGGTINFVNSQNRKIYFGGESKINPIISDISLNSQHELVAISVFDEEMSTSIKIYARTISLENEVINSWT